jgi:predicted HicB family RNase H-like nuclease
VKTATFKTKTPTVRDYVKLVEWSDEDQCYIGSAPPLIGQCCHGKNETAVYKELCQIVSEWIAIYEKDGKPLPAPTANREYSGKFMLRLDPQLHKYLALRAMQAGESLNGFVMKKLQGK